VILIILQSITPGITPGMTPGMTRIIPGAGDGLSEFPSDLADAGTAGFAAALSVQASDASALVTLASSIRGSDASAFRMRVLVAVSAAAVADSTIKPAVGDHTFKGVIGRLERGPKEVRHRDVRYRDQP